MNDKIKNLVETLITKTPHARYRRYGNEITLKWLYGNYAITINPLKYVPMRVSQNSENNVNYSLEIRITEQNNDEIIYAETERLTELEYSEYWSTFEKIGIKFENDLFKNLPKGDPMDELLDKVEGE